MKTARFILALLPLMAASCANVVVVTEPAQLPPVEVKFVASVGADTKTDVSMEASGIVSWQPGDSLSIFDGQTNVKVVLAEENISADGRTAWFSAIVAAADTYMAVYPWSADNMPGEDVTDIFTVAGPSAVQDGSFGAAHIAAACCSADDPEFVFHNITGILNFTVSDPNVAKMVFMGCGGETVSGPAIFMGDSSEVLADWDDAASGTTVTIPRNASGNYFLGTLETVFANGFRINCYDSSDNLYGVVNGNLPLSLKAGKIMRLGALDRFIVDETSTCEEFYAATAYGIYNTATGEPYKAYVEYDEQISTSRGRFRIINPNAGKFVGIKGIPDVCKPGTTATIMVTGNTNSVEKGSYKVFVGKVDGTTVWLHDAAGTGFIIKMPSQ